MVRVRHRTWYKQIPNAITLFRMILIAPIYYCLVYEHYRLALILFIIAGISDGFDGFLARRYDWKSRFGSIADPAADKLLIVLSFIALTWVGVIPWWLMATILLRDLVIVIGAMIYHIQFGRFEIKPSLISKINTGVQLGFLILLLLKLAFLTSLPKAYLVFAVGCVFASCLLSGVDYVWVWSHKAHQQKGKKRHDSV